MAITTAMASTFKAELMSGGHCFNATVTPTASVASASASVTFVSSMAGVAVGMTVTATNVPANAVVAAITSPSAFTLSAVTTGAISGTAITVAGDVFKMALIKISPTGTYTTTVGNYADITAESDEVSAGGGYTTTGTALTNVSAVLGSTTAYITFSPNPSWVSATFSCTGCMIS